MEYCLHNKNYDQKLKSQYLLCRLDLLIAFSKNEILNSTLGIFVSEANFQTFPKRMSNKLESVLFIHLSSLQNLFLGGGGGGGGRLDLR